jgi:Pyridoxamine 5'-phosphate oxidase
MPITDPIGTRNLDGYGAPVIDFTRVVDVFDHGFTQAPGTGGPGRHTSWLTTIDPDGRPHVMPLGLLTVGRELYFNSGPGTRKSRNIARDPRCVLSVATEPFDLVVEGVAERVTDPATLRTVAETFNAHGWPTSVDGDALTAPFSAPAAGPPPWHVYRVVPTTVFALGTAEPYGATRFDLPSS